MFSEQVTQETKQANKWNKQTNTPQTGYKCLYSMPPY